MTLTCKSNFPCIAMVSLVMQLLGELGKCMDQGRQLHNVHARGLMQVFLAVSSLPYFYDIPRELEATLTRSLCPNEVRPNG